MLIQLYDTTLRDGSQSPGITFSLADKLRMITELDAFGIDYIEAGSPGINPKEGELFAEAAKLELRNAKLVAFGSTCRPDIPAYLDPSVVRLMRAGTPAVAIVGKCWLLHVREVLKTTPEENLRMISDTIACLKAQGREVIFDAEHFFNGFADDPGYSVQVLKTADKAGADVICLCDTLGGVMPDTVAQTVTKIKSGIDCTLAIHCHNDSGVAIAASIEAIKSGASQIQGTMLGLGERCGNTNLAVLIPTLYYKYNTQYYHIGAKKIRELTPLSRKIAEIANIALDRNMPYVGENAFTHKAGMHIDAHSKAPGSMEHIPPEAVGNARSTLISEVAGRAAILSRMKVYEPGLTKDSEQIRKATEMIKQAENRGYQYENAEGSLALLLLEAIDKRQKFYELETYKLVLTEPDETTKEPQSAALIKISVNGSTEITAAEGDGPVNAIDKALRKALTRFYPAIENIRLTDYKVRVLDSTEATAAQVRVLIESTDGNTTWRTVGVSTDIIQASWTALSDSIDYALSFCHE